MPFLSTNQLVKPHKFCATAAAALISDHLHNVQVVRGLLQYRGPALELGFLEQSVVKETKMLRNNSASVSLIVLSVTVLYDDEQKKRRGRQKAEPIAERKMLQMMYDDKH